MARSWMPCTPSCAASSCRTASSLPTSRTRCPYSRAAWMAPSTSGAGARSEPIASTAMVSRLEVMLARHPEQHTILFTQQSRTACLRRASGQCLCFFDFEDFAALVHAALRACVMRQLLLFAVRALGDGSAGECVVRAAGASARFGVAPFWIRHWKFLSNLVLQLLAEFAKRRPAWVLEADLTPAIFCVAVVPALRTQTLAFVSTEHLCRHRQQHLLLQNVFDDYGVALVETDLSVTFMDLVLVRAGVLALWPLQHVKIGFDVALEVS